MLAVAGLIVAAALDGRATAFAPGVPNNAIVASVRPSQTLCDGPVPVTTPFDAVVFWARPAHSLRLIIRSGQSGAMVSRELSLRPPRSGRVWVGLHGTVAPGRRIKICFVNTSRRTTYFEGGPRTSDSGALSIGHSKRSNIAIALLFLRDDPPSLLSLLPTVFQRASLFKLVGLGPWIYWLLFVLLIGCFGLAARAVTAAVKADARVDDET